MSDSLYVSYKLECAPTCGRLCNPDEVAQMAGGIGIMNLYKNLDAEDQADVAGGSIELTCITGPEPAVVNKCRAGIRAALVDAAGEEIALGIMMNALSPPDSIDDLLP